MVYYKSVIKNHDGAGGGGRGVALVTFNSRRPVRLFTFYWNNLKTEYLFQRLSVAIQRGNAVAVMGCPLPRLNPPLSLTVCYDLHCVYVLYHYSKDTTLYTIFIA